MLAAANVCFWRIGFYFVLPGQDVGIQPLETMHGESKHTEKSFVSDGVIVAHEF